MNGYNMVNWLADVLQGLRINIVVHCLDYKVDLDKQYLDRVISAYACTRNSLNDLDYVNVPLHAILER